MENVSRNILVADDEENVRHLLKRILEQLGYNVVTAGDGIQAIELVSQHSIDLALLDIKMPRMTGMEVLAKLSIDWPDICVIMITAVTDNQTAIKAMKMGAYDYITKPFNQDELVITIRRALENRDLQLKNKRYSLQLQQSVKDQAQRMQSQFTELVKALAREHKLMWELSASEGKSDKSPLSKLPPELQQPMSSVEEFRDALIRILRGGKL
jgi:DNA-binding NtrC family response regulator